MPLKPEASIGVGLATGALVYAIFDMSLPPLTDVRAAEPENGDVQSAERAATWTSAALVTGVALLTTDATVFVIGGAFIVGLAWLYRHSDQVSPLSGLASGDVVVPGMQADEEPQDFGYGFDAALEPAA